LDLRNIPERPARGVPDQILMQAHLIGQILFLPLPVKKIS
jgi:hypothetical protein